MAYIADRSAPELGFDWGTLVDAAGSAVNWTVQTASKIASAVTPKVTTPQISPAVPPPPPPPPSPTRPTPTVVKAAGIGLPVILVGGAALFLFLRRKK